MSREQLHVVVSEEDRENEIWTVEYEINRVLRSLGNEHKDYRKALEDDLRLIYKWKRDSEILQDMKEGNH